MAGWPARLSRAILGPKRKNEIEPDNDVYFVAAKFFNMVFWQVSGANLFTPKAGGLIVANALTEHEEAWDPDGDDNPPTFVHVGTGHYRITYAGTYKDDDDVDVAPTLTRARGFGQSSATFLDVTGKVTNGVQVDIRCWDAAGAALNADVWFEAY